MDLLGDIAGFMNEPIPSFYFEVTLLASGDFSEKAALSMGMQMLDDDASAFHQVTGLKMSYSTESWNEAGWAVPRASFEKINSEPVTLVRYLRLRHIGVSGFAADPFSGWCQETTHATKTWKHAIQKKDVIIQIYHPSIKNPLPVGPSSFPVAGFLLLDAYPVEWSISDLDSTNDSDPIKETIALQYTEMQRLAVPPV